jgi:hypothetical protein
LEFLIDIMVATAGLEAMSKRKTILSDSNGTPVFHPYRGSLRPLTAEPQLPARGTTQSFSVTSSQKGRYENGIIVVFG